MAVDSRYGDYRYPNIAGYVVQLAISPANGFVIGTTVGFRVIVFLQSDANQTNGVVPDYGTPRTLTLTGDGVQMNFPNIEFRGDSYVGHNREALLALEFSYSLNAAALPNDFVNCTATVQHKPNVVPGAGRSGGALRIADGNAINLAAHSHKSYSNGSRIIRTITESQLGDAGLLAHLLANWKDASTGNGFDLKLTLNGKVVDTANTVAAVQFVEYEERYGFGNHCALTPLSRYVAGGSPSLRELDSDFAFLPNTYRAASGLQGPLAENEQYGACHYFMEVMTAKLTGVGNVDFRPAIQIP